MVPTDDDQAHFESLPVPLSRWEPFQQCLSKHLSELTEGQIDREETFWFEAAHVNRPNTRFIPSRQSGEQCAAMLVFA
jgi:hypothetical protein